MRYVLWLSVLWMNLGAAEAGPLKWKDALGAETAERFLSVLDEQRLGSCDREKVVMQTSIKMDIRYTDFRLACANGNTAIISIKEAKNLPTHITALTLETPTRGVGRKAAETLNNALLYASRKSFGVECARVENSSIEEQHFCQSSGNTPQRWTFTVSTPNRYADKNTKPPLSYSFHCTPDTTPMERLGKDLPS